MSIRRVLFMIIASLGFLICVAVLSSETVPFNGQIHYNLYEVVSSPNGKVQAKTNKDDNTVQRWDVTTSKQIAILNGHKSFPFSLLFSPDGQTLASASDTIRLWDVTTGEERIAFGHPEHRAIICLAFSPDGQILASGSMGDTLFLWDVASGKRRYLEEPPWLGETSVDYPTYIAFSADGKTLAAIVDERVGLWDVASGKHTATLTEGLGSVTYSTNGKLLVLREREKGVTIRELTPIRLKLIAGFSTGLLFCMSVALSLRSIPRRASGQPVG
jgi:WD40 repeat protein